MRLRTIGLFSILVLGLLAGPLSAEAQALKNISRIGVLELNSRERPTPAVPSFRKGLRDIGYVEGQNILLDYRYADGKANQFPAELLFPEQHLKDLVAKEVLQFKPAEKKSTIFSAGLGTNERSYFAGRPALKILTSSLDSGLRFSIPV